ncbi:ROK family transcriptional regulator [Actinomadura chibensis]|uniref:ROK family transcriptional regulator n=1 Tax=Actinomadura chibensis TaxID=392828 RepID=A0A5D0NLX4_9ACTN|nr:ROK family transcriptional regulator [Actinomadura chibensis]TYB45467.1 ROK family transcriptional regulator [Actinomadura chibensis]
MIDGGGGPALLRRINESTVLARLHRAGPLRLGDLSDRTELSRQTIAQVVASLVADGLVEYVEDDQSGRRSPGRPARLVRLRPDAAHVVGIDIGPHRTLAVVADLTGRIVAEDRGDSSRLHSSDEMLAHVRAQVRETLARGGVDPGTVRAVAVGTPGIVEAEHGVVVKAPDMPGWTSIDLADRLRPAFGCPVMVENDVNLAVLAERWRGGGPDAGIVVAVQWGGRVGAGILVGDRLLRGAHGAAGEVGFLPGAQGPPIGAATLGPFERRVGTTAIAELANDDATPDDPASATLTAARAGDPTALRVIDTVAARFVEGLAPLILILDPDLVVIGGGVVRAGPPLLEAIERHLGGRTLVRPTLALSTLGDHAVALGAARLALDEVERQLFTVR